MYDEENDFAAMARTSNLNEELGQVKRFSKLQLIQFSKHSHVIFFSKRLSTYLVTRREL
jgi:hypothetical protein